MSDLYRFTREDAARASIAAGRPNAPTISAIWEAARRDFLFARSIVGISLDPIFDSYVGRRGGLTEEDERTLAEEAAKFFREKREAAETLVAQHREMMAQHEASSRAAQGAASNRATWVERELSAFLRVAGELREIADAIEASKGVPMASIFTPGAPPIESDEAIVALCTRVGERLNAAGAVVKLTSNDAMARMRMEHVK